MKRIAQAAVTAGSLLALALGGTFAAAPVLAASKNVEDAIKTLGKIEADATKFKSFCKIIKDLDDVPDQDMAKAEALEAQLEAVLKSMGADVMKAWDLGGELDPASEDGKAFEAAIEGLEEKCPD